MSKRIFISHSSADKDFINSLLRRLQDDGFDNSWYDINEIGLVDNVHKVISTGISQAEYFLIVISKNSVASNWVNFEVQRAISLEKPIIALVQATAQDFAFLINNPFLNQILSGGQHKILNFDLAYDASYVELLKAIAPNIAEDVIVREQFHLVFDHEDPDVAEQAMGFAALKAKSIIPGLLCRLGSLRDSRKLRFRGERLCCRIGAEAIEPLFAVLTAQIDIPRKPTASPPSQTEAAIRSEERSTMVQSVRC